MHHLDISKSVAAQAPSVGTATAGLVPTATVNVAVADIVTVPDRLRRLRPEAVDIAALKARAPTIAADDDIPSFLRRGREGAQEVAR